MRRHWGDQLDECAYRFRSGRGGRRLLDRTRELVELRYALVELQAFDGVAYRRNRLVQLPLQRLVLASSIGDSADEPPDALDEARSALNSRFGPFEIALGRAVRKHEPPDRVGAVLRQDRLGVDGVAPGL